jgi:hypothetical protein
MIIWCNVCGKNDYFPHTPIDHPWLLKGHRLIPKPKVDEMVAAAIAAERARMRTWAQRKAAEPALVVGIDEVLVAIDGEE